MNRFFEPFDPGAARAGLPLRLYARLIDAEAGAFALFDAVAADDFDRAYAERPADPGDWRRLVESARVFAVEVNVADGSPAAADWLKRDLRLDDWHVLEARESPEGEALLFDNISDPEGRRVSLTLAKASDREADRLATVTDLAPDIADDADIETALPTDVIRQVFVLDVGQGSAAALVNRSAEVVAYADLGAGVLKDKKTWPSAFTGLCLCSDPTVILSHWHYDHFDAANTFPAARGRPWIAPYQTLGPGPQSAMAAALSAAGPLLVWNGSGRLTKGSIILERCTGPAGNQNRTGIAVWLSAPDASDPILLPGDAGYGDFTPLANPCVVTGLAVAHHGGRAPGTPPAPATSGIPRAALSYGNANRYHHPRAASLAALTGAGWSIGHPGAGLDDRRTEDRPGGTGGAGLGHIRLSWPRSTVNAFGCACRAPLNPTQ